MISRELFCEVIRLIVEQEKIDQLFGKALQEVGSGPFVYGVENKLSRGSVESSKRLDP